MPQAAIDLIRVLHLVFFALGMGSGFFFDLRALRRMHVPFTDQDIVQFKAIHAFVFSALSGLWLTGVYLIYHRTGFALSEFTPKLILKISIVTVLTLNAFVIGRVVLPKVERSVGQRAIDLPVGTTLLMTVTVALSMFCWLSGVILGASASLRTADWGTLGGFFVIEFVAIVFGSVFLVLSLRSALRHRNALPAQV